MRWLRIPCLACSTTYSIKLIPSIVFILMSRTMFLYVEKKTYLVNLFWRLTIETNKASFKLDYILLALVCSKSFGLVRLFFVADIISLKSKGIDISVRLNNHLIDTYITQVYFYIFIISILLISIKFRLDLINILITCLRVRVGCLCILLTCCKLFSFALIFSFRFKTCDHSWFVLLRIFLLHDLH